MDDTDKKIKILNTVAHFKQLSLDCQEFLVPFTESDLFPEDLRKEFAGVRMTMSSQDTIIAQLLEAVMKYEDQLDIIKSHIDRTK